MGSAVLGLSQDSSHLKAPLVVICFLAYLSGYWKDLVLLGPFALRPLRSLQACGWDLFIEYLTVLDHARERTKKKVSLLEHNHQVTSHHLSCVLSIGSKLLGSMHPLGRWLHKGIYTWRWWWLGVIWDTVFHNNTWVQILKLNVSWYLPHAE